MSGAAAATPTSAWGARAGLAAAAAVVLSVLAACWLGLPDPWWAAISAWRIASPDRRATLTTGLHRILGTVAGAVLGYGAAGLAVDNTALQLLALFAVGAVGTWERFASPAWSYAWILGAVTAAMVLVQSLDGAAGLYAFAVARTLEILCGVVVGTLTEMLLGGEGAAAAPPAPAAPVERRVALLAGLVLVLVPVLWGLFDLPAVTQIAISVLVVIDRDAIALRRRGRQRLLGCAAGGAMGLSLLALGLDGLLVWLVALGGGIFLFSSLTLGGGPNAYVGIQGGLTLIMALVTGPGPPDALLPVLDRLAGVTLGVALVVALSLLLAPRRPG